MTSALDAVPGYRRRFVITPQPGFVRSELEDDFHHMGVEIRHEEGIAVAIDAITVRAPWNTCPGAVAQVRKTFLGVPTNAFGVRGEAKLNCTHLHDLAVLGAAHAHDTAPLIYDVLVSDPIEGRNRAELRRNGECVLSWTLEQSHIVEPAEFAGTSLFDMRALLATMDASAQEATRVLRWGSIVAHGRVIPIEQQSNASAMPPSCFTFQPGMKEHAFRIGLSKDFSKGDIRPLAERAIPTSR
jgi:hypothetical protein